METPGTTEVYGAKLYEEERETPEGFTPPPPGGDRRLR